MQRMSASLVSPLTSGCVRIISCACMGLSIVGRRVPD
jgi:hypothetical protein